MEMVLMCQAVSAVLNMVTTELLLKNQECQSTPRNSWPPGSFFEIDVNPSGSNRKHIHFRLAHRYRWIGEITPKLQWRKVY